MPLLVHLHSGGWHLGNLDTEEPFCGHVCASLYERRPPGFAVLNINYRHTPEYRFPTQLDDVDAALAYFIGDQASLKDYRINPTEIYLSRTSSGAHLAIGYTLRHMQRLKYPRDDDLGRNRIKGLILTCPPTTHPDLFPHHLLRHQEVSSYV